MVVVWILNGENIFDCMMRMLLALAYPVCCMVVLYVAILSCDDHQFNWWEQMGDVSAVSKEMAIPLLSHLGGTLCFFLHGSSLGLQPMYCSMPYDSTLSLLDFYLVSVGIVVCPVCRSCVKTPGLLHIAILYDVSFNFA